MDRWASFIFCLSEHPLLESMFLCVCECPMIA
jgi:hypothetical protein